MALSSNSPLPHRVTLMLISYRRYKGIVTKMRVIKSGGVMMAATSMIMRNECTSKVYNKYYRGALLYYFCVFVILKFAELYSPSTRSSLL